MHRPAPVAHHHVHTLVSVQVAADHELSRSINTMAAVSRTTAINVADMAVPP